MTTLTRAPVRRISLDEVKQRSNDMVFVDARSATALRRDPTEMPGAIHIPIKELESRLNLLPRNRTIVTYCT